MPLMLIASRGRSSGIMRDMTGRAWSAGCHAAVARVPARRCMAPCMGRVVHVMQAWERAHALCSAP